VDASENLFGDRFSMSITDSAGKTTAFNVNLAANDNNQSAMQAMANQINSSSTGIRASLVENKDDGRVSLQLSSSRTGETNGAFTVNDQSGVTKLGEVANVTSEARNAQYSVNGTDFSSQSNQVSLQTGVTATLNQTGSTQLTYQADTSGAVKSAQNFIDTFNSLRDAASGSSALTRQLNEVASNYSRGLGFSGIGMDSKGNLSITDESKLSQSISDGSFSRNFQGVSSFGDRLHNVAQNAYKTAYSSAVQSSFKDFMENNTKMFQPSQSQSSTGNWMNDMLLSTGLFFNTLA
jgi:hypothetical protein